MGPLALVGSSSNLELIQVAPSGGQICNFAVFPKIRFVFLSNHHFLISKKSSWDHLNWLRFWPLDGATFHLHWSNVSMDCSLYNKSKSYWVSDSVTEWVSEWVTRSPIELFWTAKNHEIMFLVLFRSKVTSSGSFDHICMYCCIVTFPLVHWSLIRKSFCILLICAGAQPWIDNDYGDDFNCDVPRKV